MHRFRSLVVGLAATFARPQGKACTQAKSWVAPIANHKQKVGWPPLPRKLGGPHCHYHCPKVGWPPLPTTHCPTPIAHERRAKDDFLAYANEAGELLDFHALRHTCGAWLAMTGSHPKTVQMIMRHSRITLAMDTYGHLFPGQEADAVANMRQMLIDDSPQELRATGTDDNCQLGTRDAQRVAQRAECETARAWVRWGARRRRHSQENRNAQAVT